MFNSDVQGQFLGANSDLRAQARIFPSALRNPQNSQLHNFNGYNQDMPGDPGVPGFVNRNTNFDILCYLMYTVYG